MSQSVIIDPPYRRSFVDLLAGAYATRGEQIAKASSEPTPALLDWAKRFRRIDGQPFNLTRFAPLRALYEDESPRIVVIKAAQRGVSEWAVTRAVYTLAVGARRWAPHKTGLNVGYIFPSKDALYEFSKERFGALTEESDQLASLFETDRSMNAVSFKRVGDSYLYLRGAMNRRGLKGFAADALTFDEFDEMAPALADFGRRRLGASDVRHELLLSTPSYPNHGIDAAYQASDQRQWHTHCPACGVASRLDFWRDVWAGDVPSVEWRHWSQERIRGAENRFRARCPNCQATIDPHGPGEWVTTAPEKSDAWHGYHVPWNGFDFVKLVDLAVNAIKPSAFEVTHFYNDDLGLPHEDAGTRITTAMLDRLDEGDWGGGLPDLPRWYNTTMGVDIGARMHVRITSTATPNPDDLPIVRYLGAVPGWEDVDRLMRQYHVQLAVIDAQPEINTTARWVERWVGRALRAFFASTESLGGELYRVGRRAGAVAKRGRRPASSRPGDVPVRERDGTVEIDRTRALDDLQSAIARLDEYWPRHLLNDAEAREHLTNVVRGTEQDKNGNARPVWRQAGPDHYAFAAVYNRIAHALLPRPIARAPAQASVKVPQARA